MPAGQDGADGYTLLPPFAPELAGLVGFANAPIGADGMVRRFTPVLPRAGGGWLPALSLATLAASTGLPPTDLAKRLAGDGDAIPLPLREASGALAGPTDTPVTPARGPAVAGGLHRAGGRLHHVPERAAGAARARRHRPRPGQSLPRPHRPGGRELRGEPRHVPHPDRAHAGRRDPRPHGEHPALAPDPAAAALVPERGAAHAGLRVDLAALALAAAALARAGRPGPGGRARRRVLRGVHARRLLARLPGARSSGCSSTCKAPTCCAAAGCARPSAST